MSSSAPDRPLDHYARLVRRLLRVPVGLVTLVGDDEQVFAGADGWEDRRTPLTHSFCHLVVTDRHPLVVTDARHDELLAAHPAVREMGVVAYAGWPVYGPDGSAIGSVCAVEHGPREWKVEEVDVLRELAHGCSVELRRASELEAAQQQLTALRGELAALRGGAPTP